MELEREVADLQLRLRASQQKEDAASLSQKQIGSLTSQVQAQEKKVGLRSPAGAESAGVSAVSARRCSTDVWLVWTCSDLHTRLYYCPPRQISELSVDLESKQKELQSVQKEKSSLEDLLSSLVRRTDSNL